MKVNEKLGVPEGINQEANSSFMLCFYKSAKSRRSFCIYLKSNPRWRRLKKLFGGLRFSLNTKLLRLATYLYNSRGNSSKSEVCYVCLEC